MFNWIKRAGLLFQSVHGWYYVMGVIPSIAVAVLGYFEGLRWSETIALVTVTLASGLLLVWAIFAIYQRAVLFLSSNKERTRILGALSNLGENIEELDLMTAAGIWAGTLDEKNVVRHSYFRGLKNAIKRGDLKVTYRPPKGEPRGPHTRVTLDSLLEYWQKRGVIK